jgi:DNA-binding GntR family transcriptional regulator
MATEFAPLKNRVLRPEVAKILREAIFGGKLKAGDQIQEATIANQLGVSRSPLREALLVLEKEGLIQIKPHRGAFVRNMSEKEMVEILSLRFPLEVIALSLARPKMTPEILEQLNKQFSEMHSLASEGNIHRMIGEEFAFHKTIWAASGHELLNETLVRLCTPWFAFAEITFGASKLDFSENAEVHQVLIDYLASRTTLSALECQQEHFRNVRPPLRQALKLFPELNFITSLASPVRPEDGRNQSRT